MRPLHSVAPKEMIQELIGKTISKIDKESDRIEFTMSTGEKYLMYHNQDCCESVTIEDIIGDLNDLIGNPILEASERSSKENPHGITKEDQDSFTWTFYHLVTVGGVGNYPLVRQQQRVFF
jgi:hypothetical protein